MQKWPKDKKHKHFGLVCWRRHNVWFGFQERSPHWSPACVFPAGPYLFVSIFLNVGDKQKPVIFLTRRIRDPYWWTCLCCCELRDDVNCVCLFLWEWLLLFKKKKERKKDRRKERKDCPSCLCSSLKIKRELGAETFLGLLFHFFVCLFVVFAELYTQDKLYTAPLPSCSSSILFYPPVHHFTFLLVLATSPPSLPNSLLTLSSFLPLFSPLLLSPPPSAPLSPYSFRLLTSFVQHKCFVCGYQTMPDSKAVYK